MHDTIFVISPHPQLTVLARQIAPQMRHRVEVVEAYLDTAISVATELEKAGVGAIVTKAFTASTIQQAASSTPIIVVDISFYSLLRAVQEARQYSKKIAYIGFATERIQYYFDNMELIATDEIKPFYFKDKADIRTQARRARDEGFGAAVASGLCIVQAAKEAGMHGILIEVDRQVVRDALLRAEQIVAARRRDLEKTERLRTVLESSHEGIIVTDQKGTIVLVNAEAEKLIGISSKDMIGSDVAKWTRTNSFSKVFEDGSPVNNKLTCLGDKYVVVTRNPIIARNEVFGTVVTFQDVTTIQKLEQGLRRELRSKGMVAKHTFEHIVGRSPALQKAIKDAREFAQVDATVLLMGESGTGKELFAQSIHNASTRRNGPFVGINCATLPENLLESELFGYDEGAFTGAKRGGKAGLFELAHGGTLFLDEIGELPLPLQAHLLRVLQEKEIRRVGGDRFIPVDVRVIAATNRDLKSAVREGKFRSDLFFRLNVLSLRIPPLRERKEDIPMLVEHFVALFSEQLGTVPKPVSPEILELMTKYDWPGNVRELEHLIQKYCILARHSEDGSHLLYRILSEEGMFASEFSEKVVEQPHKYMLVQLGTWEYIEAQVLSHLFRLTGGNKHKVAKLLGISRTTVWKKLKGLAAQGSAEVH